MGVSLKKFMNKVLKNIIIVLILFITVLLNSATRCSAELYKIKSVHFDISGSVIFVPVKSQTALGENLKVTKLENVNGVEIELLSATIDKQPTEINFSEGTIKEFFIEQLPASSKITLIFNDKYNSDNLKISNINNNLIITTSHIQPYNMNYYINTYRETTSPRDYKEDLSLTVKTIAKETVLIDTLETKQNSSSMKEINQAFENSTAPTNEVYTTCTIEDLTKDVRLRSKYYLFDAKKVDNVFKISGVGTISLQKPFMLENPQRMVFDIPNSMINPDLHNKELMLDNGDILKMAQFNPNTARLVITSEQAAQYIPVYNADSQGIYIANPRNLLTTHLPKYKANIVKFNCQKVNSQSSFFFEFDKPLTYAIKRTNEYLYLYFLNAEKYNDNNFHSAIKNTAYSDMTIHLLSTGMRVKLPLKNKENLNTFISPDGKLFKISTDTPKIIEQPKSEEKIKDLTKKEGGITAPPKYTNSKNKNVIVIDAGHGGKDCGALRGTITEKSIVLDVSKKLQNILQKKGYKVYMTRTDDTYVSLEDRTTFTEGINPAVFVSVHVNSCNTESPKGIETHYYHDDSIELADSVHRHLTKRINTTNRGLFKSRFYVINHTTVPAILVEIGFISNPSERQELTTQQRQQATAEGIAEGIIEFIKNAYGTK